MGYKVTEILVCWGMTSSLTGRLQLHGLKTALALLAQHPPTRAQGKLKNLALGNYEAHHYRFDRRTFLARK